MVLGPSSHGLDGRTYWYRVQQLAEHMTDDFHKGLVWNERCNDVEVQIFFCIHQDIPTGADSCVTSLSCDSQRSLIVAGLGDGSVRVFDRRMGPNEW